MEKRKVLIKSKEEDTGIVYTYLLSEEDAGKIIENKGLEHFKLEEGCYAGYVQNKLLIRCPTGGPAFLDIDDVNSQIRKQLEQ